MNIHSYLQVKSKTTSVIVALIFALFLGFIDYLTGFELRIDVFYLLPIAFAVWYISKKAAVVIATISILLICFSDLLSKPRLDFHFIDLWNLSVVYLFFIVVIWSLSKLRETLDEQTRLSAEHTRALADLKRTNESLEAFSYSVSHDLRAPLRRIQMYAQMIKEDYSRKLDEKGKEYIQSMSYNTQIMQDLIDALLKLSRYSRGSLNRSRTDLTALVRMTLEENAKSRPERKVEMVVADGVTVDGDPALLQVVIANLITNAWKFTKGRPVAKIEFGTAKIEGKDVYFIRDNGAGFSMENVKRLFNPFQRLHTETEFPGIGIGLAMVQRIIHRHGGRIWAEGEPDKGAIFYFTLS